MKRPESSRRCSGEEGIALVIVIIVGAVMMLLVAGTLSYAVASLNLSRHDQDWNAALSAAESGLDDYLAHMNRDASYWNYSASNSPPDGNMAFQDWVAVPGSGGAAYFRYDVDTSTFRTTGNVVLTATGKVRSTTRTIRATVRRRNFLDYLYLTDYETQDPSQYPTAQQAFAALKCVKHYYDASPPGRVAGCNSIFFRTGDVISGPMHTNDAIAISGSPQFLAETSTSWEGASGQRWWGTGTPVFIKAGDPRYLDQLSLPPSNTSLRTLTTPSPPKTGCLYSGPTSITLNATGTMNVTSPFTPRTCATGSNVALPANGVVYVDAATMGTCPVGKNQLGYPKNGDTTPYRCRDGDVFLSGTLKGQLTIAAANRIVVIGDVKYQGGLTGTDLLGLVPNNSVEIYHPVKADGTEATGAPADLEVDAAVLALAHSFIVQNYDDGTPRGTLTVKGSISQKFRGPVGTFGGSPTGYTKAYNYDQRLKYTSPPYFLDPVQSAWHIATWAEIPPAYAG